MNMMGPVNRERASALALNSAKKSPDARANSVTFPGDTCFDVDEESFRLEFRSWLAANPAPKRPGTVDRAWMDEYCHWFRSLADAGYSALHWPTEYGGQGRRLGYQLAQNEELARTGTNFKVLMAGSYFVAPVLMAFGTDEQKRHLPGILQGKERWSMLLSEPDAGSDLFSLRTLGQIDGDQIVLTGQKIWTSYGHVADYGLALVRTDADSVRSRGLSLVIVDMSLTGVTVRPIRQMNGEAEFNEVFLNDVAVSMSDVVGKLNHGAEALIALLSAERTGLSLSGYADLIENLERLRPIVAKSKDSALQHRWVVLWSQVAVQRLTVFRGATQENRPGGAFSSGSLSKLQYARNSQALAELALDVKGMAGVVINDDDDVTLKFVRSPAFSIGGGTNEVQLNAIAERMLGLPR